MTQMSLEIEGSVHEVVRVIHRLGTGAQPAAVGDAGRSMEIPTGSGGQGTSNAGTRREAAADAAPPGEWTETLAHEFLAGLGPVARRMTLHVWRTGAVGIHRSDLCQRAELTPAELRSLLMWMGRVLRRLQRERGVTLSRPVAANSPLRSYFIDPGFAAVATSDAFGGVGCP